MFVASAIVTAFKTVAADAVDDLFPLAIMHRMVHDLYMGTTQAQEAGDTLHLNDYLP